MREKLGPGRADIQVFFLRDLPRSVASFLWLRLYNIDMSLEFAISSLRKSFGIVILVGSTCLFIGQSATAQQFRPERRSSADSKLTDGSNPTVAALPSPPTAPSTHAFWDRTNILLFSGIAITRGMDYASTRNFQARGRQEILLPDEVVNNSAGFASLEAAATMTSVGISYLFATSHWTSHTRALDVDWPHQRDRVW